MLFFLTDGLKTDKFLSKYLWKADTVYFISRDGKNKKKYEPLKYHDVRLNVELGSETKQGRFNFIGS